MMRNRFQIVPIITTTLLLAACGAERGVEPPRRAAETSAVRVAEPLRASEQGAATFYADVLEGKPTASGESFSQDALVAAHRRFPFGTILRVTNLDNQRSVRVRVIDRGPFGAPMKRQQRIIDLSKRAATDLGFSDQGFAPVRVDVIRYGQGFGAA